MLSNLILAISLLLAPHAGYSIDARQGYSLDSRTGYSIDGKTPVIGAPAVDVSSANANVAALLGRERPAAVFIRASYGSFADSRYTANVAAAKTTGTPAYAYLFLRPSTVDASPEQQVATFLKLAKGVRGYAVDWESDTFVSRDGAIHSNGRPTISELTRAVAAFHAQGLRVGVYASFGAPYPTVGQDWTWFAYWGTDYQGGDVWQYTGTTLDRDRIIADMAKLDAKQAPAAPAPGITFVSASGYDASSLRSLTVPAGTVVSDLTGHTWTKLSHATNLRAAGLIDGHTGQYLVLVTTARFFSDHVARPVWQRVTGGVLH